ncbi:MAG: hypothetical protein WBI40_01010 [Methylococcaceae bacterium]
MKTNQITDAIRPVTKLNPDFTHRYASSTVFSKTSNLTDSIELMSSRAIGVLDLLATQFEDESANTLNHNSIYLAIDSVIQEIQDIQAYIREFRDSQKEFDVEAYLKTLSDSEQ